MTARLPTVFLSHGSPMQAVGDSVATDAWAKLGRTLPRPAAVLIASAHWETSVPMLTGHPKPETIHDFGGFAPELYRLRYPAPGAPALAASAVALLKAAGITAGINGCRGLDHGAWVPLLRMFPDAGVPVAQISVQPGLGTAQHIALGRALAPLAADGVLVIGSGHATHNLRDWVLHAGRKQPLGYAAAFADWLHARLTAHDTDALIGYREHGPEAARAHPSEEHFLPLLVAWGAADPDARVERFVTGWETAALALDSWLFHPPPLRAH